MKLTLNYLLKAYNTLAVHLDNFTFFKAILTMSTYITQRVSPSLVNFKIWKVS